MTEQEFRNAAVVAAQAVLEAAVRRHQEAVRVKTHHEGQLRRATEELFLAVEALDNARAARRRAEKGPL